MLPSELALKPVDLVRLHLELHLQRVVLQLESPIIRNKDSLVKYPTEPCEYETIRSKIPEIQVEYFQSLRLIWLH